MPTKKFLQRFVLTMMPSAILWLPAQSSQNVPGIALDQLELHNMKPRPLTITGSRRFAWTRCRCSEWRVRDFEGSRFHNGTIEVELAGKTRCPMPGPGLADSSESPFGSRATASNASTSARRMGGRMTRFGGTTQLSTPHTRNSNFDRLRKESPEKYESYVDLEPGVWTKYTDRD